ncbi:ABC transporter substrate-binding protein [Psychrilyobacter atlanticus]|uniref:ABC transporter substrate-binding protein n=1 Tax=Psychrilyobacter atlanticus TaxID=271091 RepID=UPI00040A6AC7|nr:ABC transporter substrate-binding protein [Psychrilyobacter atlanticus]
MKIKNIIAGVYLSLSLVSYAYTPVTVNFSDGNKKYEVTFTESPKRAVTTSHFMTEILLSLGLEDKMAGTCWADNEILSELKEAYNKVPILSERYPSKEVFYSVEPDFVSGWHSSLNPKRLAGVEELMENGVNPYIISSLEKGAKVEDVYEDYITLGKIFDVEDRAEKIVDSLKKTVEKAKQLKGDKKTIRVFAYDSGKEAPFVVAGSGLGNDIITKAGGENIFENIQGNYATVSWESILEKDPNVVIIVDYGNDEAQGKIDFLKENEFTKELEAVKENKFVVVSLAEISPGPRIGKAIEHLAHGFYQEM